MTTIVNCANCGKAIPRFPSQLKRNKYHFCSIECNTAFRVGRSKFDLDLPSRVDTVPCAQCGAPVERKTSRLKKYGHVFCSRQCTGRYQSKHPRPAKKIPMECHHCGKPITVWPSRYVPGHRYYCSKACKVAASIKPDNHITQTCATCGKTYQTNIHQVTKRNGKYCSRECMNAGQRSRDDVKAYYWRSIAKQIRRRDNYTCQLCGLHQTKPALDVHHIISAASFSVDQAEVANAPFNLITLCRSCHRFVEVNPSLLSTVSQATAAVA